MCVCVWATGKKRNSSSALARIYIRNWINASRLPTALITTERVRALPEYAYECTYLCVLVEKEAVGCGGFFSFIVLMRLIFPRPRAVLDAEQVRGDKAGRVLPRLQRQRRHTLSLPRQQGQPAVELQSPGTFDLL